VTFVFLGFALFQPHESEAFFSFEEGCAFVECALVVEKDSWESSLSQMTVSISSSGRSPAFLKSFFFLFKDIRILRRGRRIETGTGLAGIEFAMPDDACLGIDLMQQREDLIQDDHLLSRAIVLVLVLGTARVATFVADSDTEGIVALHMATSLADRSTIIQTTIPSHIEVITWVGAKASCTMATHQLLDGEVLVGPRVAAMQHQQINFPR
jgi:hypothetical protein